MIVEGEAGSVGELGMNLWAGSLPDSIGQLSALQQLNLFGCSGLTALPDSLSADQRAQPGVQRL